MSWVGGSDLSGAGDEQGAGQCDGDLGEELQSVYMWVVENMGWEGLGLMLVVVMVVSGWVGRVGGAVGPSQQAALRVDLCTCHRFFTQTHIPTRAERQIDRHSITPTVNIPLTPQPSHLRKEVRAQVVGLGGPLLLHDVLLEGENLDDTLKVAECLVRGHDCVVCVRV